MRKFIVQVVLIALINLGISCGKKDLMVENGQVPYPESYREWTHTKSMILEEGHPLFGAFGGIHHLYANDLALIGLKTGKYENGSIIVFDLLEIVKNNSVLTEGQRKVLGVMYKDSRVFSSTGGWGFEGFKGDSKERVVKNPTQNCFACHTSQVEKNYVFSEFRK